MAFSAPTSLILAGGAFSAASQIMGANQQAKAIQRQANYNAEVYEQQAELIKEKRKIQDYQFNRQAAEMRGAIVNRTAGKGLFLSGSPAAILGDTETEMLFDKAIAEYDLDLQKSYAMSGSNYYRQSGAIQARQARFSGYSNAFSTALGVGANMALLKGPSVSNRTIYRPSGRGRVYQSPYGNNYIY